MVLRNRLEYGFIGYQVPPIPRGTRSARKKRLFKKEANDNQMCAFELLATVAGELSSDEENSRSSNVLSRDDICRNESDSKRKYQHADESLEAVNGEKGNCHTAAFVSKLAPVKYPECAYKVASAETLSHGNRGTQLTCAGGMVHVPSSTYEEPCCTVEKESEQKLKIELSKSTTGVLGMKAEGPNLDVDVQVEERKPPALVSLDKFPDLFSIDNGEILPLNTDHNFSGSFPPCGDDVQLVTRDDDENSYLVNRPSTLSRPIRSQQVGNRTHRRIRKLLASKYWMPTQRLKDEGQFNTDSRLRAINYNRKKCLNLFRSQRVYPPRKRKLYDYGSILNSNGIVGSKSISSSQRDGIGFDTSVSGGGLRQASVASQHTPKQSMNSLVKLKIESFKVPELFIEIPETASVGSLKRTVMEAVTSILGSELRVGVILQGKKIGDDNKTLLQTGISHNNRLNALGFSLEPNPVHAPPSFCDGDSPLVLSSFGCQPLTRSFVVPRMNVAETLAVGPIRKSRTSQGAQRRIRRPFSVSEVESLVGAVEKLGTGRWRNVKLEAFDNAKHRTYVDLKDKWKTLVHTARLHPQQRRGEPVPQELLDRVLAAHANWSKQQSTRDL